MMTSLRTKLILVFLTVSALGIALGMIFASVSTSGEFRRFVFSLNQEDLQGRLAAYYAEHGGWTGVETGLVEGLPPPPEERRRSLRPEMFTLTDEVGRVIVGGPEHETGSRLSSQQLAAFEPIEVSGSTVGWLIVPGDAFAQTGRESLFFRRVNNTLLLGAVAAFVVALVAGALAARSLTRPLLDLTAATKAVAAGDFERKVDVKSSDELGALADSFNRMSAALAEAQLLRRRMTADIAHELRTPLSIILGHLDAVDDGVLTNWAETTHIIRQETERLSRLVEDLRTLTRADAGELALERRPVVVMDLVARALAAYQPQAWAKAISLTAEVESGLEPIELDPDRMLQVLDNLLSNALVHTPSGGRIVVGGSSEPNGVRIVVQDSGSGFPPEDVGQVFDRFYRADRARRRDDGGSGLGLAIARSIVEAHGGTIEAENAPGQGATIIIEIPRLVASTSLSGED
jgi:two-component system, OmpR family, sensor histidine kinase BaeS